MTDDQQFILGLATLIVPTIASIFAYKKSASTHEAVNGMQAKKVRRARAQGHAAGIIAERHAQEWGKPPGTDSRGLSGGGGSPV